MPGIHKRIFIPLILCAFVAMGGIGCHGSDNKSSEKKDSDSTDLINKMGSKKKEEKNVENKSKKGKASVETPGYGKNKMVKDKAGVYNKTEKMAEFPGGQRALSDYIENSLQYPQQAIDDNTQGTVRVTFVVDEKGRVTDPKLLSEKKIGDGLDEEAIRVVSRMPDWKPGKVKGKSVKSRLELPITFQLSS